MAVCIYCRDPLPHSVPPDHVIPQSFGTFHPNFTLHCVCESCNKFFGRTLEWALQKNSLEAVLRFQSGLAHGTLGSSGTLEFKVAEEGPWKGVRVKIKAKRAKNAVVVEAIPLPQVGARRNPGDDWEWYLAKEIGPDFGNKYPKGSSSELQVVASSPKEQNGLIARLKKVGVDFNPKRQMAPPFGSDGKVGTSLEALFSEQIRRCIAKIAFNYLAYVKTPDFVLQVDFDEIRNYIRYGKKPSVNPVRSFRGSFLLEERDGRKATRGHIVRVDWSKDNQSIVADVALFNTMKYRVVLSNHYHALWTSDLARGHHFDVANHRIEPLSNTKLHIPTAGLVVVRPSASRIR